ncbi:nucleotide exchange factor GrpE [Desulfoplanes sp.]
MKKDKQKTPPGKETPPEKDKQVQENAETGEPSLEEEYARICAELEEQKQESLRILAESENLKKRLQREKEDFRKFATGNIIEEILPVMDNLELALQHGRHEKGCENLVQGVEMTLNIFKEALQKNGLTIIGQEHVGVPFNPAEHEAMSQVEDPKMDGGCVQQLLQTGYKLHDRLLRPAKVMVTK